MADADTSEKNLEGALKRLAFCARSRGRWKDYALELEAEFATPFKIELPSAPTLSMAGLVEALEDARKLALWVESRTPRIGASPEEFSALAQARRAHGFLLALASTAKEAPKVA